MGRLKQELMRLYQEQEMIEWIQENIGDDAGEEGSEEWDLAVQEYYDYLEKRRITEMDDYYQSERDFEWYLQEKSPLLNFQSQMQNIKDLLKVETNNQAHFSLLVMLHAHTIASLESYLASTFMQKVLNSDVLIRRLVESDDDIPTKKFTLKDIYIQHENIKGVVAKYLKHLIFHNIRKISPMFKVVLGIDFGNVTWLFKAVDLRHHCVHRAGIDYDGNQIDVTPESILILISNANLLVENIDHSIDEMDAQTDDDILL